MKQKQGVLMRDASGFPARYNLIRLYRKAVHDSDAHENVGGSEIMLAMDYFDALEVDEFHSDTEQFSKFMGLSIYEDLTEHDVAMQSIPLYCPEITEKMAEEYCCHNSCFKNPFNKNSGEYRYFGMIQVYITPEILMRLDREHLKETEKDDFGYLGIYNAFFKDLHILMSDFVSKRFKEEDQGDFCYRVYQSMSVGDFVVAIRCNNPEVPFEVASMLRRRKYELERPAEHRSIHGSSVEKELCTNFVFYKTYTLMSLNTHIIPVSSDSEEAPDISADPEKRRFVLRCVLSNKYWSHEKAIEEKYKPEQNLNISSYLRLNGRYDFTVTLSEQAFLYIHPKLVRYKIGSPKPEPSSEDAAVMTDPDEKKICDYIISLMKDKYISYVNERFLFRAGTKAIEAENYNDDIRLIEPEDGFLFANEIIAAKLSSLSERIHKAYLRVLRIDTSRRSIMYNMHLLERINSICNSINGTSDSRIYCSIIIRQIEIALDCVNYYLSLIGVPDVTSDSCGQWIYSDDSRGNSLKECTAEENDEIIAALDSELKAALEYINSFGKFILDSSLQSLQTPHFNLETHVSVEKVLLGYSYFVHSFLNWYGKTELNREINGTQSGFYTLMVPQPMETSLTTKTLFNWRKDESLKNRLLVVLCPSFSDLTDFSASIGILMHEIAHSLRYEPRSTRNKMMLRYTSELLFDQVSMSIILDLRKLIPGLNNYSYYTELFKKCLADVYAEYIGLAEEEVRELGFANLMGEIESRYRNFVYSVEYLSNLRRYLEELFSDYTVFSNGKNKGVVEAAKSLYQLFFSGTRPKWSKEEAYAAYEELLNIMDELPLDEMSADDVSAETHRTILQLYDHLVNFYQGPEDLIDEKEFLELCMNTAKFEFELDVTVRRLLMEQRNLVNSRKIARFLQVGTYADLDGREKGFVNFAESHIITSMPSSLMIVNNMTDVYREVTSDLYMVKVLGLTPYGYLNFFTRNVPVDDIMAETYAKRFCMVLYALESEKSGGSDIDWNRVWIDFYKSVCGHFLRFVHKYEDARYSSILEGEIEVEESPEKSAIADYLKELGDKISSCMDETEQDMIVYNLDMIAVCASAIQGSLNPVIGKDIKKEREMFLGELLHCRYLCSNLSSLIYAHRELLLGIYAFDYLAKDLLDGAKNLSKLHDEFVKSEMWKYCSCIARSYNETEAGQTEYPDQNRLMTEFVLDMNYSMLYSNAFEIAD